MLTAFPWLSWFSCSWIVLLATTAFMFEQNFHCIMQNVLKGMYLSTST